MKRFALALITTFLFLDIQAQACQTQSAHVSGLVRQMVYITGESRCVAFLEIHKFQASRSCPLNQNLIEFFGVPVDCRLEPGDFVEGRAEYNPRSRDLFFGDFWAEVPYNDEAQPTPNWPL